MLIALEEEAAFEDELLQNGRDEITWLKVLSEDTHQKDSAEHEQGVELHVVNRHVHTFCAFHMLQCQVFAYATVACLDIVYMLSLLQQAYNNSCRQQKTSSLYGVHAYHTASSNHKAKGSLGDVLYVTYMGHCNIVHNDAVRSTDIMG